MATAFVVEGPRGGRVSIDLRQNMAWRRFAEWLTKNADTTGWASVTSPELGRVLYPGQWTDEDHKLQAWRQWVLAGLVVDTGNRDYAIGKINRYSVGLTMKGVAACRDLGMRDIPMGVAATPSVKPYIAPTTEPTDIDIEVESTEPTVRRVDTGGGRSGPPVEVTALRLNTMRNMRDALTYALYLNDHPQRCQRAHTDELSAEELFDLAVAKAKAGK